MLIKATIEDLFVYEGINEISFTNKNFIHGINGHGKTSLINSLKLAFTSEVGDLNDIINRNCEAGCGSIVLETDEYTISKKISKINKTIDVKISFPDSEDVILGAEAEEFLAQKMPSYIADLVFYDGEIDRNIIMMSSIVQKNFFADVFNLDILVNMKKDCILSRKGLLSESNTDGSMSQMIDLEQKLENTQYIVNDLVDKKIKTRQLLSSRNTTLNNLQTKLYQSSAGLKELEEEKESLILKIKDMMSSLLPSLLIDYPFFAYPELYSELLEEHESAVSINENLFPSSMKEFSKSLGMDLSIVESLFNQHFLGNKSHQLSLTKESMIAQIHIANEALFELKSKIIPQIKEILSNPIIKDAVDSVVIKIDALKKEIGDLSFTLNEIIDELEFNISEKTKIQKALGVLISQEQNSYSKIKGIETLDGVIKEVDLVLNTKITECVSSFNIILKPIVAKFTNIYPDIQTIVLTEKLDLMILDRQKKPVTLLSAGQKQVLNFLIIKALIQYGNFSDFVVVDTPLGRLSKGNRQLIMEDCYTSFEQMTLLITDSEADGILALSKNAKTLKQAYPKSNEYTISLSLMGSTITKGSN